MVEIQPLLLKLQKNPELIEAILEDKITPELLKTVMAEKINLEDGATTENVENDVQIEERDKDRTSWGQDSATIAGSTKLNYDEFKKGYENGKYTIYVDKNKVGDFVLSPFADKHNKPAHLVWTWLGIILVVPLPIIMLFISWGWSVVIFLIGLVVINASRTSAVQFVEKNMLDDRIFFNYVFLHKGAIIKDKNLNGIDIEIHETLNDIETDYDQK